VSPGISTGTGSTGTISPGTATPGSVTPTTPSTPEGTSSPTIAPAASTAAAASTASGRRATLSDEQAGEFRQRWRDVQADFVDDPQQAVRSADQLARDVLTAVTDRIADRRSVEGWKAGEGSGTEDLRLSLRQYRTLVDRLLEL
jgi:hypothetical protein